jgi:hypothetical protein
MQWAWEPTTLLFLPPVEAELLLLPPIRSELEGRRRSCYAPLRVGLHPPRRPSYTFKEEGRVQEIGRGGALRALALRCRRHRQRRTVGTLSSIAHDLSRRPGSPRRARPLSSPSRSLPPSSGQRAREATLPWWLSSREEEVGSGAARPP